MAGHLMVQLGVRLQDGAVWSVELELGDDFEMACRLVVTV